MAICLPVYFNKALVHTQPSIATWHTYYNVHVYPLDLVIAR